MTESDILERIREAMGAELRGISENVASLMSRVASLERGEQSTAKDLARIEGKVDGMESRVLDRIEKMRGELGEIHRAMSERRGVEKTSARLADLFKVLMGGAIAAILERLLNVH